MPDREAAIARCAETLKGVRSLAVSTGAGISKESGIPTFRDAPNALWAKFDPQELASREGFARDPKLVWDWYVERRRMIGSAKPNAGHRALAELERRFDKFTLITQNIDDLHRKAGSKNIVEVHGNVFRYKCFDNDHPIDSLPDDDHVPPRCHCGSLIRPDVVWFGEMLPEDSVRRAHEALLSCDALLVVGTSGIVYPAAGFPLTAKAAGAYVVEVNPEVSAITAEVDLFLQGPAGTILPELVRELKRVAP